MGAVFNFEICKESLSRGGAVDRGLAMIETAKYDHGHAGYSGSWAECDGVKIRSEVFDCGYEAKQWLDANAEKWGPMLIVKLNDGWAFGACCSE